MAVIKLKRIKAERGSQTINAGELAIAGTKLYYGPADMDVNATNITPTQVAGTNISNIFTGVNTFSGPGQTISIKDQWGNENYTVENGRLKAKYPSGFHFNENDLVDRSYVDASAQGLVIHDAVKVATTTNLTGYSAGVITFSSPGVWSPDGLTMALNDRILVKGQSPASQNGIYYISTLGTASVATVLTRAEDMNGDWTSEVYRAYVFVDQGAIQDTSWVTSVNSTGTVGTDSIVWNVFSRVSGIFADEVSLTKTSNILSIKDGAVTPGDFTVGGELTVGTPGETWSIDGSAVDKIIFTRGSYTATLPQPTAIRHTIAYTSDLPAGVDVIVCATAAATVQKDITVTNYAEADGKQLYVDFTYANTAASPTLRVNTLTARAVYISGAAAASGSWAAGDVLRLAFDAVNNRYHILENLTTRQYYGNAATVTNGVYTNTTQSITGTKTFNNSALKLLGSSTGATTFTSANSGSTDYIITIPAVAGTLATINNAQTFTAAQTFRAANSVRAEVASTQDAVVLAGRAGGASSYAVTLTPTTLSGNRTLTLPDAAGTIALASQIPSSFTISASSDALVASGGANSVSMNVATAVTAGKFYRHATNPTATTGSEVNPIKYEGWFYATQLEGVIDGGTTWA